LKIPVLIVYLTSLVLLSSHSYGQHSYGGNGKGHNGPAVRQVVFLTRNGDYVKNISAKIKVPVKEITKANKISQNYLVYPGRILFIPVHVQPRVWDPTKEDMSGNSPSREDRPNDDDYELVIDSSNYKLAEDFIYLNEAKADSIEYENIANHLRRIDKKINYLRFKLDSVKQTDFKFDYEEQDKSSALGKVKMTRDKYYAEGPIGKAIDSLVATKDWLGQRRIMLRDHITEYEYIVENAGYAEKNFMHDDKEKVSTWGDHLAYESNAMKSKPATLVQPNKSPSPPPAEAEKEKNKEKETVAIANTVVEPPKQPQPKTEAPPIGIDQQDVNLMDTFMVDTGAIPHFLTDFMVYKPKFTAEVQPTSPAHIQLTNKPPYTKAVYRPLTTTATATAATKESPKAPSQKQSQQHQEPQKDQVIKPAPTPDPPAAAVVNEPTVIKKDEPEKKKKEQVVEALTPPLTVTSSEQPAMKLDEKIDTVKEKKVKEVSADPLASYKQDSGFVVPKNAIKDIPIAEYKNKPKYLQPVDSTTRIKGDFYLIRARQVLEKGDFKTGDKYLRKSLDINPNDAQAWMLHADLFLAMGLADQSLKEYIISSEIDSTNPKVFYNIALLYTKANNHQKAYKYFTRAIEASDKYLLAYMGRASLQMDEHDYEGAIKDYDRVLKSNKYYTPAYKARGLAKMELHRFADAIVDFNQYLEIEDPDGYVIYQRGISKIYSNSLLQGCLDLSSSQELGFKEAEKAIKKFCE